MQSSWEVYDLLLDEVGANVSDFEFQSIHIGLTWTLCRLQSATGLSSGLSMSPAQYTRTLPWAGELKNYSLEKLCSWIRRWDSFESVVAQSVINAVINANCISMLEQAIPVYPHSEPSVSANLSLFAHFMPQLKNKKVVVIGHYPGIELFCSSLDLTVLERFPNGSDLPDNACEYIIPEADWVFITASSIANKTFPRLAELAKNAVTVLMGPSVPWLSGLNHYGIDFLAGVNVADPNQLQSTIVEGGGVRIFEEAVQYHVLDIGNSVMLELKKRISDLVAQREILKAEMDSWYHQNASSQNTSDKVKRFPKWRLLEQTDRELSLADTRYKRQWDARQNLV